MITLAQHGGALWVHEVRHEAPMDLLHPFLEWAVAGINLVAAVVLIYGVVIGAVLFLRYEIRKLDGGDCEPTRRMLRRSVGFYLLLALELLIAADILETMLDPTWQSLVVLAGVAGIRIVISYALGKELEHEERLSAKEIA